MKKVRLLTPISLFLRMLLVLTLGILLLAAPNLVQGSLRLVLSLTLLGSGVLALVGALFYREKRSWSGVLTGALMLLGGLIILLHANAYKASFGLLFGLWALINGILRFVYVVQLFQTQSPGKFLPVTTGAISVGFGIAMMLKPVSGSRVIHIIVGIYLLLYAFTLLLECIEELFRWNTDDKRFLSHLRIQPPTIFTMLIPQWLMRKVNEQVQNEPGDLLYVKGQDRDDGSERLQVLFHLGKNIAMGFGHVDILYDGMAYSYGCYDDLSNRFGGLLSDGTLLIAPEKPYVDYCIQWEKKSIIGFVIRLNVAQDAQIREALRTIYNGSTPWTPTPQNAKTPGGAKHVVDTIPAQYRKLQSGPFKIYNAVKTNCVAMGEMLVNEAGVRILPTTGIITPGSYYAFMERRLQDPDSRVVRKIIYKRSQNKPA